MKAQGGWCGLCLEQSPGGTVDWGAHSIAAAGPACPGGSPRAGVSQGTAGWLRDLVQLCPSSQLWGRDQIKSRRADVLKLWKTRGKRKTSGPSWNTRCNCPPCLLLRSRSRVQAALHAAWVFSEPPPFSFKKWIQKIAQGDSPESSVTNVFGRLNPNAARLQGSRPVRPGGLQRTGQWGQGAGSWLTPAFTTPRTSGLPPSKNANGFHVKAAAVPMSLLRRGTEPSPCSSARVPRGPPWGKSPGILTALTLTHSDISCLG